MPLPVDIPSSVSPLDFKQLLQIENDKAIRHKINLETRIIFDRTKGDEIFKRFIGLADNSSLYKCFMYIYDNSEYSLSKLAKNDPVFERVHDLKNTIKTCNNGCKIKVVEDAFKLYDDYTKLLKQNNLL
jgi:hypothetical protein